MFLDDVGRCVGWIWLLLIFGILYFVLVFGDCGVGDIDKVKCVFGRICGVCEEIICLVLVNGELFFCEIVFEKLFFEFIEIVCLVLFCVVIFCCGIVVDELFFVFKEICDDGGIKIDLVCLDLIDFGLFWFSIFNGMKGLGVCFCRIEGLENGVLFGVISFDFVCFRIFFNDIFVEFCKSWDGVFDVVDFICL